MTKYLGVYCHSGKFDLQKRTKKNSHKGNIQRTWDINHSYSKQPTKRLKVKISILCVIDIYQRKLLHTNYIAGYFNNTEQTIFVFNLSCCLKELLKLLMIY